MEKSGKNGTIGLFSDTDRPRREERPLPLSSLTELAHAHRRRQRWLLLALLAALLLLALLSLLLGAFSWWPLDPMQQQVLLQLRLPRTLLAMLVGAALAMSGATLQILLHNPVAEPGLLGISSGAGLCAMLAMSLARLLGWDLPAWGLALASFGGALAVTLLLTHLARRQRLDVARLLLLGIAVSMLANAAMTWLLYFSDDASLREFMFWMMGSLAYGSGALTGAMPLMLLALLLLVRRAGRLELMQLGEAQARLMGLDVTRERTRLILLVCLLTALAVSLSGVIGFVGLLVPHLLRLCGAGAPRILLPASALGGAALLLGADLLARHATAVGELPIGVVTATLGAPLFIFLLVRHHADAR